MLDTWWALMELQGSSNKNGGMSNEIRMSHTEMLKMESSGRRALVCFYHCLVSLDQLLHFINILYLIFSVVPLKC